MPIASPIVIAQRLRQLSWVEVGERAWIALICAALLELVMPAGIKHLLRPLVLALPLSIIAMKDLSHLPDALARMGAARARRDWPGTLMAWLPPELVGLLRLDARMRHGFLSWARRRPQPALPEGQVLTCLEQGSYRTAFVIVLLATLFEMPFDALIASLFLHDAHKTLLLHELMLAGALSTLVWALGDRWHMGRGCHVLTSNSLELRVGARTHGSIPLHAVLGCERLAEPAASWCRRHGIERRATLLASPLDKPNTVLMLDQDCPVRLTTWAASGPACAPCSCTWTGRMR
jgi:hypothetical protein